MSELFARCAPASTPEMSDASPYKPSVATYFPRVPDFARDANGDPIISSLRGPERTEARQQLARERLVAAAEVKILHEQLKWCYFQEGVNHLQNCKVRRRRDGAEGGGVAFVSDDGKNWAWLRLAAVFRNCGMGEER